jgi:hypothetical protein
LSLLTEHCSQGIALGTGLSKLALESNGEGGEDAVRHPDTLVGQVRHDAGPVAPIDGSWEVDLDWSHLCFSVAVAGFVVVSWIVRRSGIFRWVSLQILRQLVPKSAKAK